MENNNDNKKGFWHTIKDNPKILEKVSICLGPCSHPDPISSYSSGYFYNMIKALNSVDCSVGAAVGVVASSQKKSVVS